MPNTTTSITPQVNANATAGLAARGKVLAAAADGVVKFAPSDTNYELHLRCPDYAGAVKTLVTGVVRVQARKAYTVPSGGNFISPIYGPPKTIQGRVRAVEGNAIVVQAGTPIHVQLPAEASGVDMAHGPISIGALVNVVALPGATFELIS